MSPNPTETVPTTQTPSSAKTRSGRRGYFTSAFVLLIVVGVFFLPSILIHTPLKQMAIDYAAKDLNGKIEVDSISTGWLSPVELGDIRISDNNGAELASIASIQTSQTLIGLILGNDLGEITIAEPTLDLKLSNNSSNIEDLLDPLLNSTDQSAGTATPNIALRIKNGLLQIRSESLDQPRIFDGLEMVIVMGQKEVPLDIQADLNTKANSNTDGHLSISVRCDEGQPQLNLDTVQVQLSAEQFAIDSIAPLLTRIIGPSNTAGQMDGKLGINIGGLGETIKADVSALHISNFALVAPRFFGNEQLYARYIKTSGIIESNADLLVAEEFQIETEFADANLNGKLDFKQFFELASATEIPAHPFHLQSNIDLASIANMFPNLLKLKENSRMNSGILNFIASNKSEMGRPKFLINAEATNVQFNVDGNNVNWHQPLRLVGVASKQDKIRLEEFRFESEFVSALGSGNFESGSIDIRGDLGSMMNQLKQVVDTSGYELDGKFDGRLSWESGQQNHANDLPIDLDGIFKFTNPKIRLADIAELSEPKLNCRISGRNRMGINGAIGMDSLALDLEIGNERATAQLIKPIQDIRQPQVFQFKTKLTGSLAKWISQARNFVEFPEFVCDGILSSQFLLSFHSNFARINQLQLQAQDFQFQGFGLDINEQKITGRGNIRYQYQDGRIEFTKFRAASSALAAQSETYVIYSSPKFLADGSIDFRGDANLASQWLGFSRPGDPIRWDGNLSGNVKFNSSENQFGGIISASATNLIFAQPRNFTSNSSYTTQPIQPAGYVEVWREPNPTLKAKFGLAEDFNSLNIQHAAIKSKAADLEALGSISDLAQSMQMQLKGQWKVKWEPVNTAIRDAAGEGISITGDQYHPLRIEGPLYVPTQYAWVPNELSGITSVSFSGANLYGIPVSDTKINIQLKNSLATLNSPASNHLIDQFLLTRPVVDLRKNDPWIRIRDAKLLDHWSVTEQDSRSWLKFAAPLIADATSTQGQVSLQLGSADVPVFEPQNASAAGAITLHELVVGPGPLAQQIIPLIDQLLTLTNQNTTGLQQKSRWIQLESQAIPVAIRTGRVYHEHFRMKYKDVTIETRGSVGFDQSLELVAEIPIHEDWVKNDRYFKNLIGQSISIPITGTVSRPKLDSRAITQISSQLVKQAATGFVNEKIGGEVNKLRESINSKVQGELNQIQNQVNDKIKTELEDKLKNELRGGLNRFFGGNQN